MTELIAVFRSRAQAVDCNMRLKKRGVQCALINTPKEANVGCGLSVIIPKNAQAAAKKFIYAAGYSAFYGFLNVKIY